MSLVDELSPNQFRVFIRAVLRVTSGNSNSSELDNKISSILAEIVSGNSDQSKTEIGPAKTDKFKAGGGPAPTLKASDGPLKVGGGPRRRLCNHFRNGKCSYGNNCKWAHIKCKNLACKDSPLENCLYGHECINSTNGSFKDESEKDDSDNESN